MSRTSRCVPDNMYKAVRSWKQQDSSMSPCGGLARMQISAQYTKMEMKMEPLAIAGTLRDPSRSKQIWSKQWWFAIDDWAWVQGLICGFAGSVASEHGSSW